MREGRQNVEATTDVRLMTMPLPIKLEKSAIDAGATAKIVAPKVGGVKLADGSILTVNGQLAGTPSVLFDAIAVILLDENAKALSRDGAAVDFVHDAFII